MPAAVVIGRHRVVRFAAISPDWLIRAEPTEILAALSSLDDGSINSKHAPAPAKHESAVA